MNKKLGYASILAGLVLMGVSVINFTTPIGEKEMSIGHTYLGISEPVPTLLGLFIGAVLICWSFYLIWDISAKKAIKIAVLAIIVISLFPIVILFFYAGSI
ncbi:hypothetical protein WKH31_03540 [Metabacillus indicus]|uniref:hypothetical protein n=1 Tax=Metabacillus indicus TaxID=246786 RepID=UPI0031774FF6